MLNKKYWLIGAIVFQFLVLTGMVVKAQLPLWTGQEVRIKTVPRDPRSLFRGNYARLNYAISSIPRGQLGSDIRKGEVVYVKLAMNAGGLYEYESASLDKPTEGVFIRGRVTATRGQNLRMNYGIDAFFAPKQEALRLEKDLRAGAVAVLMVSSSGQVALQEIVSLK